MIIYGKDYCVCVCVNSTFGRCCHCPCEKEGEEFVETIPLIINNGIDINAIVSDASVLLGDQQTKVRNLVNLFLKADDICNECIKNTAANDKIVLVYDVSENKSGDGYDLKYVSLNFSYCEKHQKSTTCEACAGETTQNLTWCGHKVCNKCLARKNSVKDGFVVCNECNAVFCDSAFMDLFGTHLFCNDPENAHYVCFKDKDGENPYKKNDGSYDENTWVCPKHRAK